MTEITQFNELRAELTTFVSPALAIKVTDFQTSASAINAAKAVKEYQKKVEAKRKELVGPLNDQVKLINEYAKSVAAPLENAELHLKKQLTAFELEQEKIRRAEFERAEEERKKREAELLAKQEEERKNLASDSDAADVFGSEPEDVAPEIKAEELELKQLHERVKATQEAKDREYPIKNMGIKNARKQWKCEAIDLTKVPREFLTISLNSAAVLAAARGGMTDIPGVKLWQETTIAIGANTYVPNMALTK